VRQQLLARKQEKGWHCGAMILLNCPGLMLAVIIHCGRVYLFWVPPYSALYETPQGGPLGGAAQQSLALRRTRPQGAACAARPGPRGRGPACQHCRRGGARRAANSGA
jgi:hypothetical protein